jgi:hypothetical protein
MPRASKSLIKYFRAQVLIWKFRRQIILNEVSLFSLMSRCAKKSIKRDKSRHTNTNIYEYFPNTYYQLYYFMPNTLIPFNNLYKKLTVHILSSTDILFSVPYPITQLCN